MDGVERDLARLEAVLEGHAKVLVALSGGIDSSVVAAAAYRARQEDSLAVTLTGPSHPARDLAMARKVADIIGIPYQVHTIDPMTDVDYVRNDADRCYFCRRLESAQLWGIARQHEIPIIVDGVHRDDLQDVRPGLRALAQADIRHPLLEASLGKREVRAIGKLLGLPNHDAPANACLASRVTRGIPIRREVLVRVNDAEEFLVSLGFNQVRVRTSGLSTRIEVPPEDIPRLSQSEIWSKVKVRLHSLGFEGIETLPVPYVPAGRVT